MFSSLIERELRNPTLDTLLHISSVLEVDLADLVNEAMRVERHHVLQAQPYERTATPQGRVW